MTSPGEADLTPEERRLRAYLEREKEHGGWPEHLVDRNPDLFPVHPPAAERAGGTGLRRLLTIALPLIALLLVAEATDSLIGGAWLLAILTGVAALTFWIGFLAPPWIADHNNPIVEFFNTYYRVYAQGGFFVMVALIGVAGYFGWREQHTVDDLAVLITPVPEIEAVTYIPSAAELEAMSAGLAVLNEFNRAVPRVGGSRAPEPRLDLEALTRADRTRTYWSVETRLDTTQVMAFYDRPENRVGWQVVDRGKGQLLLRRGPEQLIIFARDDWPRPRVLVAYLYASGDDAARP